MHIGLAGAGRMGAFHAEVLAALPDVAAVTVVDADHARAEQVAHDLGLRTAAHVSDLPGQGIDALVIAAATPAHAPLIEFGADAGLPVFCEKPIALDLATTDVALGHVRRAGTYLQIGFNRRFDHGFRAARDHVAAGDLGTLMVVRAGTHDPAPPPREYLAVSGGVFRDMHIHDFDAIRFVTGQEVVDVYADGDAIVDPSLAGDLADADTTAVVMRLSGGTLAVLTGARTNPLGYDVRMELFGTGDSITVGVDARTPLRSVEPASTPSDAVAYDFFIDRFREAYRAQMVAFVDAVRAGADSPCTGDDARAALLCAMAAERSRAERRPVTIAEVEPVEAGRPA